MPNQNFDLVANGNNWRAFQGPYGAGHAMSMNRSSPTVPGNQRGVGGAFNVMLIDTIAFECAGYGATASVRARVWDSNGNPVSSSATTSLAGASTSVIDVPLNAFSITPALISGDTLYRWGLWSTQAIGMQRVIDSTFNIWQDVSIGADDAWSTGNTQQHPSGSGTGFVGYFSYYFMPTPPSISSSSSTSSSVTFSWSAPSNNGGKSVSGYRVDYKPSSSGSWINLTNSHTSTSITISGLASSTTYNVRVSAKNQVSDAAGTTSDYATADITTSSGGGGQPTTTLVPNLNNLTRAQANTALSNAGLVSSASPTSSGATALNNDTVVTNSQSPATNTVVNIGSTVSFTYYVFTPPVGPPYKISVWNGTSWVTSTPRIWNGTSWVEPGVVKVWNGTSWVDPT